jgi:hypothetical protein
LKCPLRDEWTWCAHLKNFDVEVKNSEDR